MAITATTSVFTGEDWKYAKDIQPGDWIFNRLGQPVKVKMAQMYRSEDCYRVTFNDYLTIEGDMHIAFPAETTSTRIKAFRYKGVKRRVRKPRILSATHMAESGLITQTNRYVFSVPTTEPIQLPHQPVDIPPFIFGFWFMARKSDKTLTVPDEFYELVTEQFKKHGYKIVKEYKYVDGYKKFTTHPSVWSQLIGKMPIKIPLSYLNGSPEQRLELIQGILCNKPFRKMSKEGHFIFKSSRKHISAAFQYLSETLGATSALTYDKHANTHNVKVQRLQPFLPEMAPPRPFTHYARRYVKSIEPIPAQLCVHIETDDSDGSYLVGEGFIPCH